MYKNFAIPLKMVTPVVVSVVDLLTLFCPKTLERNVQNLNYGPNWG